MLRLVSNKIFKTIQQGAGTVSRGELLKPTFGYPLHISKAGIIKHPKGHNETDEEFDDRMECYFARRDIDGWELRQGLNNLAGMDLVPEPRILIQALYACRRLNDYSATTRMLEMVKFKCGPKVKTIYPYIIQELKPALDELGISTPEELGYDEPELALYNVHEMD